MLMAAASAQAAALAASGQGISSYGSLRRKASTQDTTLRSQLQAMDPNDVAVLLAETDSSGKSALHHATWRGHIANVEALLDCGADVNAWSTGTYNYGKTPIFYAITRDRDEVVELLLRRGAAVDLQNQIGWTALMGASFEGNLAVARRLLQANANVHLQNHNDNTALTIARQRAAAGVPASAEIVSLLYEAGAGSASGGSSSGTSSGIDSLADLFAHINTLHPGSAAIVRMSDVEEND